MSRVTAFFAVPDDAVFIGPPRSQVKGEAHHAVSLFPPPPSTFQGAVRTRILLASGTPLDDRAAIERCVGTGAAMPDGWELEGPWVAEPCPGDEPGGALLPWLPTPVCIGRGWGGWRVMGTRQRGTTGIVFDAGAPPEMPAAGIVVTLADPHRPQWIDARVLAALLAGSAVPLPPDSPPPMAAESRVGLALEPDTRSAERANLYFRKAMRLGRPTVAAGLFASLTTPDETAPPVGALTSGVLRLGRRGRALTLAAPPPAVDAWQDIVLGRHLDTIEPGDDDLFWLVLASPVSLPDPAITGTPACPKLPALGVVHADIVAAVHLPPIVLGGLDMASGRSKPNRAFLMPGSAWGVRLRGGNAIDRRLALRRLHHQSTLGPLADRPFGFGRTWVAIPHVERT